MIKIPCFFRIPNSLFSLTTFGHSSLRPTKSPRRRVPGAVQHDPIVLVIQGRPPRVGEAELEAKGDRGVHIPGLDEEKVIYAYQRLSIGFYGD